jgi:hypothetical protein
VREDGRRRRLKDAVALGGAVDEVVLPGDDNCCAGDVHGFVFENAKGSKFVYCNGLFACVGVFGYGDVII